MEKTYVKNTAKKFTKRKTAREIKVYFFIMSYIHEHGRAPSTTEIAADLDTDARNILPIIRRMEMSGCISRDPNKKRSIVLIKPPTIE